MGYERAVWEQQRVQLDGVVAGGGVGGRGGGEMWAGGIRQQCGSNEGCTHLRTGPIWLVTGRRPPTELPNNWSDLARGGGRGDVGGASEASVSNEACPTEPLKT